MSDDPVLKALETLLGGQTQLHAEMAQVQAGLTQVRADLTQVQSGLTLVQADLTQVKAEQTKMRTELTHVQAEQTRLRVDVLDRFDRMETKLTAIREDITVNMGRADTAHRAVDNTRDDLRALSELVYAMERRQRSMGERLERLEK
jgi:chromosome segregation ATPase